MTVDGGTSAGFFTRWNGADLGSRALLAKRKEVRFEEVIDHVSIGVAPGGTLDTMLRREAARVSRPMSYRVEVSGLDVAVRFVAAAMGNAVLPREGALGHSKARALVFVLLSDD